MFYKRSDALSHISCLLSISGLPPGWGELRGRGEEKGKGTGFFFSKHRGAFHVSYPWEGVWWATSNFCPVEFKLGCSWATTWEWQPGSELLGCGSKANTVLFDSCCIFHPTTQALSWLWGSELLWESPQSRKSAEANSLVEWPPVMGL